MPQGGAVPCALVVHDWEQLYCHSAEFRTTEAVWPNRQVVQLAAGWLQLNVSHCCAALRDLRDPGRTVMATQNVMSPPAVITVMHAG
jgi:hypothetical protein